MKFTKKITTFAVTLATFLLVACGGGGSSGSDVQVVSTPVASNLSFSTAAIISSRQSSQADTFNITGTCTGTGSENSGLPYASTLYGGVYAKTTIITINYTNCTGSGAITSNSYLDAEFRKIAAVDSSGIFVEATIINELPSTVRVGDTLTLNNLTAYSNSLKTTLVNTAVQSMVVEADTNQSVILKLVTIIYSSNNQLAQTTQYKIRLDSNGSQRKILFKTDLPSGQNEIWTYN